MSAWAYLLECADGSLYAGWTNDPDLRMEQHNAGKGAKYTRSRLPVKMVYLEKLDDQSAAMKRECAIKKLNKKQKLALIETQQNEKSRPG